MPSCCHAHVVDDRIVHPSAYRTRPQSHKRNESLEHPMSAAALTVRVHPLGLLLDFKAPQVHSYVLALLPVHAGRQFSITKEVQRLHAASEWPESSASKTPYA